MARKVSVPRDNETRKTSPARWDQFRERPGISPQWGFAAATVLGIAVWGVSKATLPFDAVMPIISTLFLVLAAAFGVVAWRHGRMDPNDVTYMDIAGALTLIGLCTAATIDPDQMVRLVHSGDVVD